MGSEIFARRVITGLACGALICAALGGCAIAIPLQPAAEEGDITSSILKSASPLSPRLEPEDWRRAKAALTLALDPQGTGARVNWDNPQTGARGYFAAPKGPYAQGDAICRAFHAEFVAARTAQSLDRIACRQGPTDWTIEPSSAAKV